MESIDTLRRMWAAGATFSQIGMALHRSRNAIAGKVQRLKLPKRGADHLRAVNAQNARKRWSEPRPPKEKKQSFFRLTPTRPKERKPPMFLRIVTVPESVPVPLVERTGCAFPVSGESPHLFCNTETRERSDYCEVHFRVMYPRGKREAA